MNNIASITSLTPLPESWTAATLNGAAIITGTLVFAYFFKNIFVVDSKKVSSISDSSHSVASIAFKSQCHKLNPIMLLAKIISSIFHFFARKIKELCSRPHTANYFAYGSNLSQSRLEKRIGKVKHLGIATLKNYTLTFNKKGKDGTGKANIEPRQNSLTFGVVYQLTNAQLDKLDSFEGAPHHYERKITSCNQDGSSIEAITFVAKDNWKTSKPLHPSKEYLNHILQGAIENHLQLEIH